MQKPKLKIVAMFARHGVAKYASALVELRQLLDLRLPGAQHDIVVIDNALPDGRSARVDSGTVLIGSSNAAWEFSAWDTGLAYLGDGVDRYDFVVLVTSAFRQFDPVHLDRLAPDLLNHLRGRPAALGHIDCYDEPVELFDHQFQSWLRSSFIILQPSILKGLGSLVSVRDGRALFSGDASSPFRRDSPISEPYRRFIIGWLTGEGTGQGVQWHSRFALDEQTLPLFEAKTLAILNEQMLSHRLRMAGCATVDLTWFAQQWSHGRAPDVIPEWRLQLAQRRVS